MKNLRSKLPDSKAKYISISEDSSENTEELISLRQEHFIARQHKVLLEEIDALRRENSIQAAALALKKSKEQVDRLLAILQIIPRKRIHRRELISLGATFNDFQGTAYLEGILFRHFYMQTDWFRAVEQGH